MNSKQRFLTALERKVPDRLPVTTHHVLPCLLEHSMDGISVQEFFDYFGLDATLWIDAHRADISRGEYFGLDPKKPSSPESSFLNSENWIIRSECISKKNLKRFASIVSLLAKQCRW